MRIDAVALCVGVEVDNGLESEVNILVMVIGIKNTIFSSSFTNPESIFVILTSDFGICI